MIEIKNVYKKYGEASVLEDVSFKVDKGEIVGFLGQNGAGKTTLMRIIMGFFPATQGSVEVDGVNVLKKPIDIRSKIGYLPENNPLYLDMQIHEYLSFIAGVKKVKNKKEHIKDVIQRTMLEEKVAALIGDLSKGFKQRVGLAAALLGDPDILILDEPSSGLDPKQAIAMRELIKEVGKTKTVIFSSHVMQEVEAVCDRVLLLHDKKIVKDDTLQNVIKGNGEEMMTLIVSIDGPENNILEEIGKIKEVQKLLSVNGSLEIGTFSGIELRKKINILCVERGWVLLEMKEGERKLEDLFTEIIE